MSTSLRAMKNNHHFGIVANSTPHSTHAATNTLITINIFRSVNFHIHTPTIPNLQSLRALESLNLYY